MYNKVIVESRTKGSPMNHLLLWTVKRVNKYVTTVFISNSVLDTFFNTNTMSLLISYRGTGYIESTIYFTNEVN